ncbi:hypothetical protein ABFX02_02G115300 [Erythranthe guttata]
MGKWNRRYLPRTKFRNSYEYEETPSSTPIPYSNHQFPSGVEDNRVPSWEIDYCKSERVPWNKVLAAKKYIYCYPSVLNWDACAGKEALDNAKQRYWAKINGLPCDNSLPDQDMYIDEIDWNPYMDPKLMADLELQVPNTEEAPHMVEKLETINEEVEPAKAQCSKNQSSSDNPWEMNHVQSTVGLTDAPQGWSRWEDSVCLKNDNPWEQSCSQVVDSSKDNVWRSNNDWPSASSNNNIKQTEWGCRENNSWNRSNGNAEKLNNSYENNYSIGSKDRGWRENKNESWGWRGNSNDSWGGERNYRDSRSFRQGGSSSFRGDCRKRENSLQHNSKYKSSRYQGDTYGDSKQF